MEASGVIVVLFLDPGHRVCSLCDDSSSYVVMICALLVYMLNFNKKSIEEKQ